QPTPSPIHTSEVPLVPQTDPSPTHTSEVPIEPQTDPSPRPSPSTTIHDSIPESSGGNLGGHSSSDKSLSGNEGEMTLQSVYDLCLSLCAQVSDQAKEIQHLKGRKYAKGEPSVHKDPLFDEIMETEDVQDVGRTIDVVDEEKENDEDVLSTAQQKVNTDKEKVSTDRPIVSTDGSKVSTDRQKDSTDEQNEGTDEQSKGTDDHTEEGRATQTTQPPTSTIFRDDETIAKVLLNMSQAKAPLPRIDPKDKGKKKIVEEDESESESDGKEERNRLAKEKATNEALIRNYDDIKARIEADRLLAEKLQEEEREQFTIEERAKFLHDTIAAQRKFLAQQRSEAIRNRPPTKNQLRNQMMTYLKHVGNFKHSDLKTKKFEEIQALYEKIKRSDEDFISIGSAEDERLIKKMIKKMNEKGIDSSKNEMVKEEDKEEEGTKKRKGGHIKMIARKKARKQSDIDSDDEHKKCLKIVTFESILDSEIMEKKSVIARLNKVSSPDGDYLVIYRANGNFRAFNYLMEKGMNKVTSRVVNKIGRLSHGGCMNHVESAYWSLRREPIDTVLELRARLLELARDLNFPLFGAGGRFALA
ncbi:hypothetical protein Tco_0212725, partial [Tanacetum coccineum]